MIDRKDDFPATFLLYIIILDFLIQFNDENCLKILQFLLYCVII